MARANARIGERALLCAGEAVKANGLTAPPVHSMPDSESARLHVPRGTSSAPPMRRCAASVEKRISINMK